MKENTDVVYEKENHDDNIIDELPPTCGVVRKHDDLERRRSSTVRIEPAYSSSESRQSLSSSRARSSGILRLLHSGKDSLQSSYCSATSNMPPSFRSRDENGTIDSLTTAYYTACSQKGIGKSSPLEHIVLKMTAYSEDDLVTTFSLSRGGGSIGRDPSNAVSIPADKLLAAKDHCKFFYQDGHYYIEHIAQTVQLDGLLNEDDPSIVLSDASNGVNSTFVRLCSLPQGGSLQEQRQWPLYKDTIFRVGKCDFIIMNVDTESTVLTLQGLSGKCMGKKYEVLSTGASIGRSTENTIHMGDGELSRKHAFIWFDKDETETFYLVDLQSTNGTFMALHGPYASPYRIAIGDDLLVAQTTFTVQRLDVGACAHMGARKSMEDAHVIVQNMEMDEILTKPTLQPQSFFAVYDGHGGAQASSYLGKYLHYAIQHDFHVNREVFHEALQADDNDVVFNTIEHRLKEIYESTDKHFLEGSEYPQAGSTATTVFLAGTQCFVANVGDSRTVLSRQGKAIRLSNDHKPSRADEAKRVRDTGGFVIHGRIMGELAVSRAFGDYPFKNFEILSMDESNNAGENSNETSANVPSPATTLKGPLVIPTPEITRTTITKDDEFILLASDGLFDVLEDQVAIDYLRQQFAESGDVQAAVEEIVRHAIHDQRSMDNVTVVVIILKPFSEFQVPTKE